MWHILVFIWIALVLGRLLWHPDNMCQLAAQSFQNNSGASTIASKIVELQVPAYAGMMLSQ